jgi:serine protease Do
LNVDGEMIGLNAAVRIGAQGIGFAIPIDNALAMASHLLTVERVDNHWHGITGHVSNSVSHPEFIVESVDRDSPAAKAGVRKGDSVSSVDGRSVRRAIDLECALIGHDTGESVPVVVRRGQESISLRLMLAERTKQPTLSTAERAWSVLGLRLQTIPSGQFRNRSNRYRGGLQVVTVRQGSPAHRQGIRSGDILVGMHIWETVTMENVAYILRHANAEEIKFYILRGNDTLYGHLPLAGHVR